VHLVVEAGGRAAALAGLLEVASALVTVAQLLLLTYALGDVAGSADGGRGIPLQSVSHYALLIVLFLAARATQQLCSAGLDAVMPIVSERVAIHADRGVMRAAGSASLSEFQSPDFYDRVHRARLAGQLRPVLLVSSFFSLIGGAISIAGIMVVLSAIDIPIALATFAVGAPAAVCGRWIVHRSHELAVQLTENDRLRGYLSLLLTDRLAAKEVRTFRTQEYLLTRYELLSNERLRRAGELARSRFGAASVGILASTLVFVAAVYILVEIAGRGQLTLATAGVTAFGLFQMTSRGAEIASASSAIYESAVFLHDFAALHVGRDRHPTGHAPRELGAQPTLVLDNVAYRYPGASRAALERISLTVARGQVVGLVGENGAGKSTLAALAAGLLTPDQGSVAILSASRRVLDVRPYVTAAFQEHVRYPLSAAENIGIGDVERIGHRAGIVEAARSMGVKAAIDGLDGGWDARLALEVTGGAELSAGQWQRIALARLAFRQPPFVILDEPTSTLDPDGEWELMSGLRALFPRAGILLITHRLAAMQWADHVLVLNDGRLAASGTHDEVMAASRWYRDGLSHTMSPLSPGELGLQGRTHGEQLIEG